MAVRLIIPGTPEPSPAAAVRGTPTVAQRPARTDLLQAVEVVGAFSLSPAARARGAGSPQSLEVEEDDVLEFELDGVTFWTSVGRYRHEQALYRPETLTDAGVVVDGVARPSAGERGVRDWAAGAVRVLRLGRDAVVEDLQDPALREEFARDMGLSLTGRLGGWLLTKLLAWAIERRLRPREGLYTWSAATQVPVPGQDDPAPARLDGVDERTSVLVFLHGTASSTRGSFGAFLRPEAAAEWKALTGLFGPHIYGFEHRTMSRSPIENAVALAEALPTRARLSLVSHSRGGLVGDLLTLAGLSAAQIAAFVRAEAGMAEADAHDRTMLQRLADVLHRKQFSVQRFLRCASPSRGTLLASENLDEFLSILTNLVGLVPVLAASPVYDVVTRITLEAARNRWKPSALPGIEAMTPASPLVRLLNAGGLEAGGTLGVVAGDIEGGHLFKRMGVFITDRFIYDNRDNDLVVNTDSMFHGARRRAAYYVYDQGADVSHFNYFNNARTRTSMARWLTASGDIVPSEFRELSEAQVQPVAMERALTAMTGVARPVAIVVPGFMGSELAVRGQRVWPDADALAAGQLGALADPDDKDVEATGLVGDVYHDLCTKLAESHEVVPWAYDWRRSMLDTASRFNDLVVGVLRRTSTPVRIVTHGMGGCVVRQWMARHAATWDQVAARAGGRVVMMGAPHRGSHDSVQGLIGTHPVGQQLALLDPARGRRGVIETIQQWPGLLELLPQTERGEYFDVETWRTLRGEAPAALPKAALLRAARAVQAGEGAPVTHADRVLALAGAAPRTVHDVVIRDGTTLLDVTTEGDGRVTYASSRLPGVVTWFVEAGHGDLPGHPSLLPALLELLDQGATSRLPTVPPSASRGGQATYLTRPEPVLYPTRGAIVLSAMGHRPQRVRGRAESAGFKVSVVYGDLRFAKFPVMVGHYEGDTIVGAEAQIDSVLEGALKTRYNLGLYPGPFGTVSVVIRPPTELQRTLRLMSGAIVLGLGRWGDLTAAQVANLVRKGALQYVLQRDDFQGATTPAGKAGTVEQVGLSILLIGSTSTANISIDDSVAAILRGIAQANQELDTRLPHVYTTISEIELVELYADTAIAAARAATRLAASLSDELGLPIEAAPVLQRGRHGRMRLTAANTVDAWRRWEVTAHTSADTSPRQLAAPLRERMRRAVTDGEAPDAPLLEALVDLAFGDADAHPHTELRFVSLSERARAEVMMQQRQPELVERLVHASIGQTSYRAPDARALFELMVPNDLKDGMGQIARVVFVVDEETARYPWELMSDGGPPLCTRIGMVRQLQTARYRPQIRATTARTAFVVGDPLVHAPFRQLPGAAQEAEVVADLLESGETPFTATRRTDRPTALDVLGGLFEQPYRIVHIAGHGHYEAPTRGVPRGRSGVVLDGGVFLTAVEIGQMLQVPELVFLNCCFIGQTGPEAPAVSRNVPYNRLAASVSRELIEMGVRAVVAAGWAVRDDAALHFARVFYMQMLQGVTFGRALQEARASTFHQFPESNTWGAYQAYGDPDFRLDEGAEQRAGTRRVAHEELLEWLEGMRQQAREYRQTELRGGGKPPSSRPELAMLDRVVEDSPRAWLGRSDVLMALGHAYGELSALPKAIEYIRGALETGELDNRTTLKAVEQLANFEVRLATEHADTLTPEQAAEARERIAQAVSRLWGLQAVAETAERHSLVGGAFKRLAEVVPDAAGVRDALRQSAAAYQRAHEHNTRLGCVDPYPIANWLGIAALLGEAVPGAAGLVSEAESAARERFVSARDPFDAVFDAVAVPDLAVVKALADGSFARTGAARQQAIGRIIALYQDAFSRTFATPRQMDSAVKQLSFFSSMLDKLNSGRAREVLATTIDALDEIRSRVVGPADAPQAAEVQDAQAAAPQSKGATGKAAKKARSKKAAPRKRPPSTAGTKPRRR